MKKLLIFSTFLAISATLLAQNTHMGHEYVDLGLPSGTLWAKYNIGAKTPAEYGDYFAWGETTPKESYCWETCKHVEVDPTNGVRTHLKYTGFDRKFILEPEDDAATVNWGGNWHTPCVTEFIELKRECKWIWTDLGGTKGYIVVGNNGNSIFLPAAGYHDDHEFGYASVGYAGCYWSSSLGHEGYISESTYFDIDNIECEFTSVPYYGCSIRPCL